MPVTRIPGLLVFLDIPNSDPNGDNCPLVSNPGDPQPNGDRDQDPGNLDHLGDACDPDADGDLFAAPNFPHKAPSFTGECCSDPLMAYTFDIRTGEITDSRPFDPALDVLAANEVRGGDCDDASFGINPGAAETPGNGVDEDCNPANDGDNKIVFEVVSATTNDPGFACVP